MHARWLIAPLLVLAVTAPAAQAELADQVLPYRDAADGVEAVMGKRTPVLRFGPQAAKLYRGLAGRKASVGCGRPGLADATDDGEQSVSGGISPETGRHEIELDGGGYAGTDMRLPRKGSRVELPFTGDPYDVCFIATPVRRSDRECLVPFKLTAPRTCVRVIVALTDAGRALVDLRARLIELDAVASSMDGAGDPAQRFARLTQELGSYVVALGQPDAAPAPGTTGVYVSATTRVVAVTLRDGSRKFVRWDGDVYSTNVAEFTGSSVDVLRLP